MVSRRSMIVSLPFALALAVSCESTQTVVPAPGALEPLGQPWPRGSLSYPSQQILVADACADMACPLGRVCAVDCRDQPTCVTDSCDVRGDDCPVGFACHWQGALGICARACEECGACRTDEDCSEGEICDLMLCLPSCECPTCNTCAGQCVPD